MAPSKNEPPTRVPSCDRRPRARLEGSDGHPPDEADRDDVPSGKRPPSRRYGGARGVGEESGLGPGCAAAPGDPDEDDWRRATRGQGTRGYGGQYAGLAAGQESHVRHDERIQQDVCEQVSRNLSDIDVSVGVGVVTLEGTVIADEAKHKAEDLAMASGVREVRNNLRGRGGGGA